MQVTTFWVERDKLLLRDIISRQWRVKLYFPFLNSLFPVLFSLFQTRLIYREVDFSWWNFPKWKFMRWIFLKAIPTFDEILLTNFGSHCFSYAFLTFKFAFHHIWIQNMKLWINTFTIYNIKNLTFFLGDSTKDEFHIIYTWWSQNYS